MSIPKDPVMLLSYINTQLRDHYPSLCALCEDMDIDKTELCAALAGVGYEYSPEQNRFC